MHVHGTAAVGERRIFESVTGAHFEGEIASVIAYEGLQAVTVSVSGRAFWSGQSRFVVEEDDPLKGGFLLR